MTPALLPAALEDYPVAGVAAFGARMAATHGVVYRHTALDAWAEVGTGVSGDEVHLDVTCDLLVALVRARVLTTRQMATLLINHLRERKALEWASDAGAAGRL